METKDVVSAVIALGAVLISLIGLIYTRTQIHRAQISQRGILFKEFYQTFFDDEEMKYVYSLTENRENIFSEGYGTSDVQEQDRRQKAIERLFAHLEVICALYKSNLLAPEDMWHFRYNIQRLSQHPGFDRYRRFLEEEWPRLRNLERGPYSSLFSVRRHWPAQCTQVARQGGLTSASTRTLCKRRKQRAACRAPVKRGVRRHTDAPCLPSVSPLSARPRRRQRKVARRLLVQGAGRGTNRDPLSVTGGLRPRRWRVHDL